MKLLFVLKSFLFLALLSGCHHQPTTPADTLFIGLSDPPTTLDPRYASDANSMRLCDLIYQSLVGVSADLKIIPEAASSWAITPGKIIFTIKPGLKFQTGKSVTLDDIASSFREYKKPTSTLASNLENVSQVTTLSPDKIIFELKKYDAALLSSLISLKILPKEELLRSDFGRHPIGSGPFQFQSWDTGELQLKRSAKNTASNLKFMTFKFVRDENTRYLKILKGELDILINELGEDKVAELKKTGQLQVLITQGLNFNYVLLNLHDQNLKSLPFARPFLQRLIANL